MSKVGSHHTRTPFPGTHKASAERRFVGRWNRTNRTNGTYPNSESALAFGGGAFSSLGYAGAGHPLAEAAFFQESLFQLAQQLIEEVVGLMNQADQDVGDYFGRAGFEVGPVGFVSGVFV